MNTVFESIKQAKIYSHPWPHYEIHNIFDNDIHNWINNFNFPSNEEIFSRKKDFFMSKKTERVGAVGIKQFLDAFKQRYNAAKEAIWHKKTHPCEFIFGTDFLQQNPHARRIVKMFLSLEVINSLESLENVKLDKSFLRIMLIKDVPGYEIPVHPDSDKKLFTLQCFFKTDINTTKDLGTQICDEYGNVVKRTIYAENTGTFFFPRQEKTNNYIPTLHAFINTPIDNYRISLMVNYCKREEVTRDDVGNKLGYLIPVLE
jgi:hypothetical protein